MTKIIQNRLRPSSMRLVRDIVGQHTAECRTTEFQSTLKEQLTAYGWRPEEIEQAQVEIAEIAKGGTQ